MRAAESRQAVAFEDCSLVAQKPEVRLQGIESISVLTSVA